MKRIHIVGRKNSGKTTLVVDLVTVLREQGLCVGTVKHTHHQHQLDTPGKDSFRHSEAGAEVVGILTPGVDAVFRKAKTSDTSADRYDQIAPLYSDCDLVVVEGDSQCAATKVEVWRDAVNEPPLAQTDQSILAVVSDDAVSVDQPVWSRADVEAIATRVRETLGV